MLALVWLLLILLGAELVLRFLYYSKSRSLSLIAPEKWECFKVPKSRMYRGHPYSGFVKESNLQTDLLYTDKWGFGSGEDADIGKDQILIYVLGDSTTEQCDIDKEKPFSPTESWPQVLENLLNEKKSGRYRVLNAGTSGYTSMEMLIDFIVRGAIFKPSYAIWYPSICEVYLAQMVEGFAFDYTHSRKVFEKIESIPLPSFPYSFLYQRLRYAICKRENSLIGSIVKGYPFKTDLNSSVERTNILRKNLECFVAVCKQIGTTPVFIPWNYNDASVNFIYGHDLSTGQIEKFKELIDRNNDVLRDVAHKNGCTLLDLGEFDGKYFREKDWVHWSRSGIHEMASRVYRSLESVIVKSPHSDRSSISVVEKQR